MAQPGTLGLPPRDLAGKTATVAVVAVAAEGGGGAKRGKNAPITYVIYRFHVRRRILFTLKAENIRRQRHEFWGGGVKYKDMNLR